jgi:hypothetical protein
VNPIPIKDYRGENDHWALRVKFVTILHSLKPEGDRKGIWWRNKALRRSNRKPHALPEDNGKKMCHCVSHGGETEVYHCETPDLQLQTGRRIEDGVSLLEIVSHVPSTNEIIAA